MSNLPVSKQAVIDVLIFMALCVPLLVLHLLGEPVTVGFFCDDVSIGLPYRPDTISQALLLLASFGGPFLVIAVTEIIRVAVDSRQSHRMRTALFTYAKAYAVFLFGMATVCMFTDSIKYSVGRLRPHFLDLCKPDFTKFNCTSPNGAPRLCLLWIFFFEHRFAPVYIFLVRIPMRRRKMDFQYKPKHQTSMSKKNKVSTFLETFVRRQVGFIPCIQLLIWIMFYLMMKLLLIALSDIFLRDSAFMKLLVLQGGFQTIINQRPVKFPSDMITNTLINTKDACGGVASYDALMIVHTATHHFQHRLNYRDTYGNYLFTAPYRLKIVFFMGIPVEPAQQEAIEKENKYYGDTVQGNFTDTYQNLTYKAVMTFRWVSQHCKDVKIILKMDDDVVLDVHRFFEEVIFCHMWKFAEVERVGKWGISTREYPHEFYPPYCSGFFVVIMPAIVEDIYEAAKATPFLWLDDVYIYGVVREDMHDVQIINLDEVAFREEHYLTCYRAYGYRCKYWVSVLGETRKFVPTLMTLRADRLRVLDICKAEKSKGINSAWYILEYECTNTMADGKLLTDSHLSFPSGHASVSVYSALFTILTFMVSAMLCCVTRVTDHKHFTTDVIGGAVLGTVLAWLVFEKLGRRLIPTACSNKPPRLPRATSIESEPQTPTPLLRPERLIINHPYRHGSGPYSKEDFANKV